MVHGNNLHWPVDDDGRVLAELEDECVTLVAITFGWFANTLFWCGFLPICL